MGPGAHVLMVVVGVLTYVGGDDPFKRPVHTAALAAGVADDLVPDALPVDEERVFDLIRDLAEGLQGDRASAPRFRTAAQALSELGPRAEPAIPLLMHALRRHHRGMIASSAGSALAMIGAAALPELCDALQDEDPSTRYLAAHALGRMGPPAGPAVPILMDMLRDDHPRLRGAAAEALGRVGPTDTSVLPALKERLDDRDSLVRASAARGLGHLGVAAEPVVPALEQLLGDPKEDRNVRTAVAVALATIGPVSNQATSALERAIQDHDPFVRARAAFQLRDQGPKAAPLVPVLIEALNESRRFLREKQGSKTQDEWRIFDQHQTFCKNVIHVLGEIGPAARQAVPVLEEKNVPLGRVTNRFGPADLALRKILGQDAGAR